MSIPNRDYTQAGEAELRLEDAGLSRETALIVMAEVKRAMANASTKQELTAALDKMTRKMTIRFAILSIILAVGIFWFGLKI